MHASTDKEWCSARAFLFADDRNVALACKVRATSNKLLYLVFLLRYIEVVLPLLRHLSRRL